jgi:hypothetical protein
MPRTVERSPTCAVSMVVDIFLVLFLAALLSALTISQCFIRF